MSNDLRKKAEQLAARPYTVRILRDDSISDDPLFLALNPELEGCMAQGETPEQAEDNLAEFRVDYIEHLLKHNLQVPYPSSMASVTGSLVKGRAVTLSINASSSGSFEDAQDNPNLLEDNEIMGEASLKTGIRPPQ
jgi:predicted RNase H-like HicB family nuclease